MQAQTLATAPQARSFSVLICTYNRDELLRSALRSIVDGTSEKPDEIVVVNGGDARADLVVAEFAGQPDVEIRLIKTVNCNLATSRNIGLEHCRSDIVAMTDDDAEVFPDWVTLHKRAHAQHPEAGVVGGLVIGRNSDTIVGRVADAITFPNWQGDRYVRTLPGVNVSYKRELLDRLGPQDETLFRGEDVDFNWRAQQLGYKVFFAPAIRVYHHHRPTLRGFLNQHYMYGRAYYLVRRKWPDMYCIYPHGIRRPHDILKLGHFVASAIYQPLSSSRRMSSLSSRLTAVPVLFLAGLGWRGGMVVQAMRERLRA